MDTRMMDTFNIQVVDVMAALRSPKPSVWVRVPGRLPNMVLLV